MGGEVKQHVTLQRPVRAIEGSASLACNARRVCQGGAEHNFQRFVRRHRLRCRFVVVQVVVRRRCRRRRRISRAHRFCSEHYPGIRGVRHPGDSCDTEIKGRHRRGSSCPAALPSLLRRRPLKSSRSQFLHPKLPLPPQSQPHSRRGGRTPVKQQKGLLGEQKPVRHRMTECLGNSRHRLTATELCA